jgi:hypothetical protein
MRQAPLRLIALIKTEDVAKKIMTAMHLPSDIPQLQSDGGPALSWPPLRGCYTCVLPGPLGRDIVSEREGCNG